MKDPTDFPIQWGPEKALPGGLRYKIGTPHGHPDNVAAPKEVLDAGKIYEDPVAAAPFPGWTHESWLDAWDSWMVYIRAGGGGDWPRLAFTSLLDERDEIIEQRDEAMRDCNSNALTHALWRALQQRDRQPVDVRTTPNARIEK